jgi:hypothetical protein
VTGCNLSGALSRNWSSRFDIFGNLLAAGLGIKAISGFFVALFSEPGDIEGL